MNAIVLALALIGGCPGGRCPAQVYYRATAPVVAIQPAYVAVPAYVAPVPVDFVVPAPVAPVPVTPIPHGCRYIWNGYMWVAACY